MERVPHDKLARWIEDIHDPYWGERRSTDSVPQRVVDDELAAFGKAYAGS